VALGLGRSRERHVDIHYIKYCGCYERKVCEAGGVQRKKPSALSRERLSGNAAWRRQCLVLELKFLMSQEAMF
jgi:hypothetical protein